MKSVGARAKRRKPALDACYREVDERAQGACEARVRDVCWGYGSEHHHVGKRSVWPELVTDPRNVLLVCRACHTWIDWNQRDAVMLNLHMPRSYADEVRYGLR